jgi:hypothetical protein
MEPSPSNVIKRTPTLPPTLFDTSLLVHAFVGSCGFFAEEDAEELAQEVG